MNTQPSTLNIGFRVKPGPYLFSKEKIFFQSFFMLITDHLFGRDAVDFLGIDANESGTRSRQYITCV